MNGAPPPPPPHGEHPKSANPNMPPGKYDIFIIPPHSSGSGFLYLPSLKPNANSFAAGFASALVLVVMVQSMAPAFRAWWNSFQGMGNMGMMLLVLAVGVGAWSLGRTQQEGATGSGGGSAGSGGYGPGAGGHTHSNAGPTPDTGPSPPPPPHNEPPPRHSGPMPGGPEGGKPKASWQQRNPEAETPQPETPKSPKPDTAKNAWEKARDEIRRKEEERKTKEAEQKRKEEIARRIKELREKEALERGKREAAAREKAQQEAREREQREKEVRERLQKEQEAKEKEAKEAKLRETREREAKEKEQREARMRESRERELRERLEREKALREKLEKEAKERETSRVREEATRKSTYAFSSVGEKTNPWPNGKPPSQTSSPAKPNLNPSSPKRPPPPSARTFTGNDEEAYSARPYDKPKHHNRRRSGETVWTESSYAPSQSTARTSPPPSVRDAYSTKDPDKIVLRGVYCFMNQFAKTPASQLLSGQGTVTDGLILRITTEGLFIDDDVRGVPQREWDVKAWTLKLMEVWCSSRSFAEPAATTNPPKTFLKPARARADRGQPKTLLGDDADVFLTDMLRNCKNDCRLCPHGDDDTSSYANSNPGGQPGQWKQRGLHVLRATIRDQEGKRYMFVLGEEEGWKVAIGLQRLKKGTQVRQLGVQAMTVSESRDTLQMLGW